MDERATAIAPDERDGRWDSTTYRELLRIARHHLRTYANGSTLCTADVVHEAYLKLDRSRSAWQGRPHFLALVARVMRHVLVDHARRRRADKRGGCDESTTLRHVRDESAVPIDDLLAIDDALRDLQGLNPRLVTVVEMRFFGGFEDREIAEQLQVSTRTVERDWLKARLFLARALAHA